MALTMLHRDEFQTTQKLFDNSFRGISPRSNDEIIVRAYFAKVIGELKYPDGMDEDFKEARFVDTTDGLRIAPVALDIFTSLRDDDYL